MYEPQKNNTPALRESIPAKTQGLVLGVEQDPSTVQESETTRGSTITPPSTQTSAQPAPQQAQAKQPDAWDSFFATLQKKQAYNKQIELDREFYQFAKKDDGKNQEEAIAFYDDWVQRRFGVQTERGKVFTQDKSAFTDSRQYANALMTFLNRGYEPIASEKYKTWMKARTADRETQMKVAGINPYTADEENAFRLEAGGSAGMNPFNGLVKPRRRKTDEEIDQELADYNAKITGENYIATFRAFDDAFHFNDEEKEVIRAALKNGDGLPEDMADAYLRATGGDPKRMAIINQMIDMTREKQSRWWRDNVGDPLCQTIVDFWNGARESYEDIATNWMFEYQMRSDIENSPNAAKFYWNEEERAEYARLCKEGGPMAADAKDIVNAMCVKRLIDEAKPHETYLQERRERLYLRDATMHKPTVEYGWLSNALAGALSSVPYMVATISPVGFIANVNSQFQSVRDGLILRGEDPDKAVGLQIAGAVLWAGIEKMQLAHGFGKPLTGLERKTILKKILETAWADGKLKVVGQAGLAYAKEVGAKTVLESGEEALQKMAQTGLESYLAKGFTMQILGDMLKDGATEYFQSMPSMFLLSAAGGGVSMARANRTAINTESLVEYAAKQARALNTFKGTLFNPEAGKNDADLNKQTQAFKKDCEEIWENHRKDGSGGVAALEEIRAKYALTQKEAETIGDWLDTRAAGLEAAKWADTQEQADRAAFVFDGLPIGNNTTYNIENLFHIIAPNAKVERTEITDPSYTPKANTKPSTAPADEDIASLEKAIAQAKERIAAMPNNAKRRKMEYELKKREKRFNRLKAAQERANAAQAEEEARTPKKAITRVTVPVGKSGETRTFTIQEDYGSPDINTPSFAVSVSVAMQGAVGITINEGTKDEFVIKDGAELSDADFAALPFTEKVKYALTEKQYLSLTPEQRDAYVDAHGLGAGGDFRILDEHGKQVFGSDGLITIMRAINGKHVAIGGNKTLAHEYGHAITRFARDLGLVTDADAEVMRQLFGAPREGVDELWNEEAANDAFAEYLRGQYDFRRFTEEERRAAMNIFQRIWDAIKSLFRQNGYEPPEVQHEINERKKAEAVAFEGMKSGDFSGLAPWAGIKFAEDEKKSEGGKVNDSQNQRPNTGKETQNEARTVANEESAQPKQNEPRKQEETKAAQQTPTATANVAQNAATTAKPAVTTSRNANTNADESDEYMRGFQAGLAQAGANPTLTVANKPVRAGAKRTVFTPDYQQSVECEAMWVSLDDLLESTGDREVQMRDRDRVATDMQVLEKTRKGVFQPLALFPGTKSDDGAPIVGGGLRIISGHGRKRMLQVLAREGRYSEYLDAINAECEKQGIPTAPAGMKNPVLVLRVTGGLENRAALVKFAERSNRWGGLERSGAEFAESDARQITPELMSLYAPDASGNLLAASNRSFMTAFLNAVGATGLTNADGTPTPEAALRVQRALMTALFGNDENIRSMVRSLLEQTGDLGLGNLQNALMQSAGRLIALKNGRASYDIVADVREAVIQYIAWRAALKNSPRLTLGEHLLQGDFFAAAPSQMTQNLAKLFEAGRFGAVLARYVKLATAQDVDAQMSFLEKLTPIQLLAQAERDVVEKDENGNPVAPYVTPDPNSAEAKIVEQTPPVVQYEPEPAPKAEATEPVTTEEAPVEPAEPVEETPAATEEEAPAEQTESADAVAAAEQTLTPLADDAPFIPAPAARGTATIPQEGTPELHFTPVNAKGEPIGKERKLKVGAYNLLRSPYSPKAITKPSTQDKAGRGLGIFNPPKATDSKGRYWGEIFPHFQGNKTEMADRTSQAIRKNMSKAERNHYTTVVDYFGGGGCWGLYHALTNFENANELIINEYEADRIAKIQLLHEIDGEVADIARTILFNPERHERLRKSLENVKDPKTGEPGSSSPSTIAKHAEKLFEKELTDPRERAAFCAFLDCARSMLGMETDENKKTTRNLDFGLESALAEVKEDGRKAKEAADAFKARGGKITYHAGDALTFDTKMGDDVVAVCDPPYYLTLGYDGKIVPLDAQGKGWDYKSTHALMKKLIDSGSAIVYTDEAWWFKADYKYSYDAKQKYRQAEFFTADFDTEQGILLDFINGFDHFDVAGRVASRQETLGIHHGHIVQTNAESNGGTNSGNADARLSVTRRSGSDRPSLFNVAPIPARESRHTGRTRTSRGRSSRGEQALARAVIAANSAATEPRYSVSRLYTGSAADYDKPSLHKVGTGEGAQAYGWGLYASEHRYIAESYADSDVKRKIGEANEIYNAAGMYIGANITEEAAEIIINEEKTRFTKKIQWLRENEANFTREGRRLFYKGHSFRDIESGAAPALLKELISDGIGYVIVRDVFTSHRSPKTQLAEYQKRLGNVERLIEYRKSNPSYSKAGDYATQIYEQTFFADRPEGDESRLLDWFGHLNDFQKKLLTEELGAEVVEAMDDMLGSEIYDMYVELYGSPEAASKKLAAIGIDGVKYPVNAFNNWRNRDGREGYNYVSFRDDNIRVDHKWTDGQQRFSIACNPNLREDVKRAIEGDEQGRPISRRAVVDFSTMPQTLVSVGLPNLPIRTRTDIVRKLVREHNFTEEQVAELPSAYESPVAVFADKNDYVVLTEMPVTTRGGDKKPVMVVLRESVDRNGEHEFLASAYPREVANENYYENLAKNGAMLFIDKNKVAACGLSGRTISTLNEQANGNQVKTPEDLSSQSSLTSIPYSGAKTQAQNVADGQQRFSVTTPWQEGFPKAVCMTTRASLMSKHGDLFEKAKAGGARAAMQLVKAVAKPEKIQELLAAHPKASIVAPVYAEERSGRNQLPRALAKYIAKVAEIEVDENIVQTVRANHTGANAAHRLFSVPEFAGEVKAGAEYIVVDDHITQGGTVNALRDHIESHGGKVVAITSLTLSHGSSIISPTKEIVDEVRRKHEGIDETLREYGIADSVECLTQSQCRYLASLSPNTLGDRIAETVGERSGQGNGRTPSGRSAVQEVAKGAPRHSVTRDPSKAISLENQTAGYLANRILGGRKVTIDEAEELLNGLGITNYSPAEVLQKANTIANYAKNNLREKVARQRPDLSLALAQVGMQMSMQEALDAAITGTAANTDPLVGRLVQKAIQSKQRRDLEAAKGFTAAEMLARLPISLTEQFLAVAEFERSPEEAERLEKARQKREEERKAAEMADTRSDDERLADFESAEVRDATPEEREAIDALLGRAKAAVQAQKAVEAAQRAAKKKAAEKKAQENGADAADADENGAGGGQAEDEDFEGLTQAHIRRIAPIFEDEHIFAQFLIEWTADAIREKHPELPSTREIWKSPVAIRELKQTATHILRRLATDILGSPTNSRARNFADHIINELESDAACTTFNAVRRKIAYIYDTIHTDGLRMSRKEQMKRLIDGWREKDPANKGKYIIHEGIRQLVGAKGRFSSTAEEGDRTTDGRTEMYGRMLIRVLEMSPEKLEARKAELEKIVNAGVDAENLSDLPTTTKVRLAADELAAIAKYGNLARELPGRIADAAAEILEDLSGKRQAFEQKRMEREAANKEIIDTLIAAIADTPAPRRKKEKGRTARYLESFQGNIQLELQNLIRYCRDPKKREAALYVIENLTAELSEGTSRYRAVKMRHQEAINKALKACYGDAAKGVNHLLTEPILDEVAAQVFGQNRGQVATYGHLLQLYASIVQGDYAENAQRYGRDKQLELIKQTLTDEDMRFYDFAVEWYRANREELSDAVEEVTGVPITSPDPLYVPVRVAKPQEGLLAKAVAWSPIPRALSMRVPHGYDFNEGANFFRLLDEQAEIHAQTVGYSALGIMLRDTVCSAEVQDAVRRNVDKADMSAVTSHLTDILAQDAAKPEDTRILDAINYARAWIARFAISGNVSSALAQPASIPVWANIMLGKHQVGFARIAYYMTHIDREAVKDLVNSDGYKARYKMGWSEEVQNAILHPSRSRIMSKIEGLYDKGMLLSQAADKAASLWIAQGFYRDARAEFLRRGDAPDLAKRKALALTWAAVEATQQTGRTEYLNAAQRGASKVAKLLFQFRTAQLLSNNYLIQALRETKAGTPGAKGRLIRAVAINTVVVPAYLAAVHYAWELLLGQEPPEDEEEWPQFVKDFIYSMVENTTAPLFFVSSIASAGSKALLGLETYGQVDSGIPAVDSSLRLGGHAFNALKDAAAYLAQEVGGAEFETELTADKIWADILRLGRDTVAPIRHGYRAYQGWTQED